MFKWTMDNQPLSCWKLLFKNPRGQEKEKKEREKKERGLKRTRIAHIEISLPDSLNRNDIYTYRNRKKESKPDGPYPKDESIKQGITSASCDYSQPCSQKNAGAKMFESHRQQQCNPPKSVQQGMIWPYCTLYMVLYINMACVLRISKVHAFLRG